MELQERKTKTTVMRSIATFLSRLCLLVILENNQEVDDYNQDPGNYAINKTTGPDKIWIFQFFPPKVSSRGLNDGLVHPGVHYADQSEGQQHHDEEVSNQYIVSAVVHSLPHLGGTNLQDVVDTLFGWITRYLPLLD